jgi:heterodisulfide reductase subunit C
MVMDYVQAALRGDIEETSILSFDCLSCGLCAVRCPAEIVPYNISQLARRLNSRYIIGPSEHVNRRVHEVEEGEFDKEIEKLKVLERNELQKLYETREKRL